MSNTISQIPKYYQRDVARATEIQVEIHVVYALFCDAFSIAQEVSKNTSKIAKIERNPAKINFRISNLFLIHILKYTAIDLIAKGYKLTPQSIKAVETYISKIDCSSYAFFNPHLSKDEGASVIPPITTPLQILYRQQGNWFKKLVLKREERLLSCFDYAILKAGHNAREYCAFISRELELRGMSFKPHLEFLAKKEWKRVALPVQPNDIIVYYDKDDTLLHAALVAQNTNQVYAKFGNTTEFAYLHHIDETPIYYGDKFQIYRHI